MNRDEARDVLTKGNTVRFEGFFWRNFTFQCGNNEDGFECCYESFDTIDEMLEHIEYMCHGLWDEVF